jgi:hypothetical protein
MSNKPTLTGDLGERVREAQEEWKSSTASFERLKAQGHAALWVSMKCKEEGCGLLEGHPTSHYVIVPGGYRLWDSPPKKSLTTRTQAAVHTVVNAWVDGGKSPNYHLFQQQRLAKEWPALACAIQQLVTITKEG